MPVVEEVGGAFLLQETQPVELHGVLTDISSGPDEGWVLANLSPGGPALWCETRAGSVGVVMEFALALQFANTLLLLASRHLPELRELDVASDDVGDVQIRGRPGQLVVHWVSAEGAPDIKVTAVEGGVEVRLRAALAAAVAFRVLRAAAQARSAVEAPDATRIPGGQR